MNAFVFQSTDFMHPSALGFQNTEDGMLYIFFLLLSTNLPLPPPQKKKEEEEEEESRMT